MFFGSCGYVCLTDVQRLLLRHQLFTADEYGMQWLPSSEPGARRLSLLAVLWSWGEQHVLSGQWDCVRLGNVQLHFFDSTGVAAGKSEVPRESVDTKLLPVPARVAVACTSRAVNTQVFTTFEAAANERVALQFMDDRVCSMFRGI